MKTLLKILLALAIITNIWMNIVGKNFIDANGEHFSIMKLELPENKESLQSMIAGFTPVTTHAVLKQLNIDYIFMAGCYPAILVLCLIAIRRVSEINSIEKDLKQIESGKFWKKLLSVLTLLQLFAWGLDVWENSQMENWLQSNSIENDIQFFKIRVYLKFSIGIAGFLTATLLLLLSNGTSKRLAEQKVKAIPVGGNVKMI